MVKNKWAVFDTIAIIAVVTGSAVCLWEILTSGIMLPLLFIILGSYSVLFLIAQLFEWRLRVNTKSKKNKKRKQGTPLV